MSEKRVPLSYIPQILRVESELRRVSQNTGSGRTGFNRAAVIERAFMRDGALSGSQASQSQAIMLFDLFNAGLELSSEFTCSKSHSHS